MSMNLWLWVGVVTTETSPKCQEPFEEKNRVPTLGLVLSKRPRTLRPGPAVLKNSN